MLNSRALATVLVILVCACVPVGDSMRPAPTPLPTVAGPLVSATTLPTSSPIPTLRYVSPLTPPATQPPLSFISQQFDVQKALETLYGPHIVFFDPQNDYNVEGAVEILLAASFAENQVEKYVILISRPIVGDCHSCGAPIEGAVFAKAGDRWQVEASNSVFGRQGSFGMAPPAQVIRIGPEKFGFLIFDTFATGGDDETQLVLYAAVNGNLKEILNVPLTLRIYPLDPNYVVPPLPDYTSRLRFVHGSNPVYDDLFLQVTEFREGSGLVNITKTYIFDGARYVLQN